MIEVFLFSSQLSLCGMQFSITLVVMEFPQRWVKIIFWQKFRVLKEKYFLIQRKCEMNSIFNVKNHLNLSENDRGMKEDSQLLEQAWFYRIKHNDLPYSARQGSGLQQHIICVCMTWVGISAIESPLSKCIGHFSNKQLSQLYRGHP